MEFGDSSFRLGCFAAFFLGIIITLVLYQIYLLIRKPCQKESNYSSKQMRSNRAIFIQNHEDATSYDMEPPRARYKITQYRKGNKDVLNKTRNQEVHNNLMYSPVKFCLKFCYDKGAKTSVNLKMTAVILGKSRRFRNKVQSGSFPSLQKAI